MISEHIPCVPTQELGCCPLGIRRDRRHFYLSFINLYKLSKCIKPEQWQPRTQAHFTDVVMTLMSLGTRLNNGPVSNS